MQDIAGPVSYGTFDDAFVEELAAFFGSRRVLEVFAGNGLLASRLAARGVAVTATSLFASHDGHDRGMHHPVIEMEAVEAVRTLGADHDVLLMSWPTTTQAPLHAIAAWGGDRDVVYVGEAARPDLPHGGYAGCASDEFFAVIEAVDEFPAYSNRNDMERAMVVRLDEAKLESVMDEMRRRPTRSLAFW